MQIGPSMSVARAIKRRCDGFHVRALGGGQELDCPVGFGNGWRGEARRGTSWVMRWRQMERESREYVGNKHLGRTRMVRKRYGQRRAEARQGVR